MKIIEFKDDGNAKVVFTITEGQDIVFRHVNVDGRIVYIGRWEDYKKFTQYTICGHMWSCELLLKFCVRVNKSLLEEMHDLLASLGH